MPRKAKRADVNMVPVYCQTEQKICPECKKAFEWAGYQWVYRRKIGSNMRYYCSYTCWRAEDHRKAAKKGADYAC